MPFLSANLTTILIYSKYNSELNETKFASDFTKLLLPSSLSTHSFTSLNVLFLLVKQWKNPRTVDINRQNVLILQLTIDACLLYPLLIKLNYSRGLHLQLAYYTLENR